VSAANEPVPVLLLVGSLEHGGAQRQVVELARRLDRRRFAPIVCTLSAHVPLAAALPDPRDLAVVPRRWRFDPAPIARVARLMRRRGVRLVHTFLFDAEVIGRLAAALARVPVVIGSERNSEYVRSRLQRACLRATRPLADAVIANSHAGRAFHVRSAGFPAARVRVVPNGVDIARFRPGDRDAARRALGLPEDRAVVGMVASFKPQKNHPMLLEAARQVVAARPDALFVLAGERLPSGPGGVLAAGTGSHRGVSAYHARVREAIDRSGLAPHVRLLGAVEHVERVYAACDLTVLTSDHEGTPNVVLESMACGVPVVATAVGDNERLVPPDAGALVPRGAAGALAAAILGLLADPARRRAMGLFARRWVEAEFSTERLAARTADVYEELLARVPVRARPRPDGPAIRAGEIRSGR
jgi:glycosyltransferase involved in cell wall biosynthesis